MALWRDRASLSQCRSFLTTAWEAVTGRYLEELLASTPARCKAVNMVVANEMHFKH